MRRTPAASLQLVECLTQHLEPKEEKGDEGTAGRPGGGARGGGQAAMEVLRDVAMMPDSWPSLFFPPVHKAILLADICTPYEDVSPNEDFSPPPFSPLLHRSDKLPPLVGRCVELVTLAAQTAGEARKATRAHTDECHVLLERCLRCRYDDGATASAGIPAIPS